VEYKRLISTNISRFVDLPTLNEGQASFAGLTLDTIWHGDEQFIHYRDLPESSLKDAIQKMQVLNWKVFQGFSPVTLEIKDTRGISARRCRILIDGRIKIFLPAKSAVPQYLNGWVLEGGRSRFVGGGGEFADVYVETMVAYFLARFEGLKDGS